MKSNSSLESIEGVILKKLNQIGDNRGTILHMLRNDDALFSHFGEVYFSEIYPGAIKAWKYHHKQTQNIAVPIGSVKFVIYDDRPSSGTYKKIQVLDLGRPDNYLRLTIPPCLWYGFTCVSNVPALLVNCADIPHSPEESVIKEISNSSIPYKW